MQFIAEAEPRIYPMVAEKRNGEIYYRTEIRRKRALYKCNYCGREKVADVYHVTKGNVKSCGCILKNTKAPITPRKYLFKDVAGRFFCFFRVDSEGENWMLAKCTCACGVEKQIKICDLVTGRKKSCGCRGTRAMMVARTTANTAVTLGSRHK